MRNSYYGGAKKKDEEHEIDITESKSDMPYIPLVYKLPQTVGNKLFDHNSNPLFSKNIPMPRFDLGFNFYGYATKDKMEILGTLKTTRKFYYITNTFEHIIDGAPEESVSTRANEYFKLNKDTPRILSRGFYKLWELLIMFNLVPTDKNNFISAHLAEGPGAFMQATIMFRDMFVDKKHNTKNDKYYAITLHDEQLKQHIPQMEQKFMDYYANEKPKRVEIQKTVSLKDIKGGSKKTNGDLTKTHTIKQFAGNFVDNKADLITADGGFNWLDENTQEQEASILILGEILTALNIQEKNGSFIVKFFETFTTLSCKLILILKQFYNDVYIVKPLMSRESNSEKYVVCMGFTGYNSQVKKLMSILDIWNKQKLTDVRYLFDIFVDYTFDHKYISIIVAINTEIANRQIESINKMVIFINKQDYFGSDYNKFKRSQIKSSQYWNKMYFPENLSDNKGIMKKTIELCLVQSNTRIEMYDKELILD